MDALFNIDDSVKEEKIQIPSVPAEVVNYGKTYDIAEYNEFSAINKDNEVFIRLTNLFSKDLLHQANILHGIDLDKINSIILDITKTILINEIDPSKQDYSIRLIDNNTHPDLLIIKKSQMITVDQIREINSFTSLKPSFAKNKIIIIENISSINNNASNAMLKLLEDPTPSTYFFIATNNISSLMTTILSRTVKHYIESDIHSNFFNNPVLENFSMQDKKILKEFTYCDSEKLKKAIEFNALDVIKNYANIVFNKSQNYDIITKNTELTADFLTSVVLYILYIINPINSSPYFFPSGVSNIEKINEIIRNVRANNTIENSVRYNKMYDEIIILAKNCKIYNVDKKHFLHSCEILINFFLKT